MDLTIGGKLEAEYWKYADDAVSSPYTCSSCLGFAQTMQSTGMISEMMLVMCSKVNMPDWKFCLHADYIEIAIFRAYGTSLQICLQ